MILEFDVRCLLFAERQQKARDRRVAVRSGATLRQDQSSLSRCPRLAPGRAVGRAVSSYFDFASLFIAMYTYGTLYMYEHCTYTCLA